MDKALLTVSDLSISFQTEKAKITAVNNISFSINPGETLALVGESGSGKSITALTIMQLLPNAARLKKSSKIFFEDTDLLKLPEFAMRQYRGSSIAMIFQEAITALNPVLTIGGQIQEILHGHLDYPKKECYKKAVKLLREVGLSDPEYCYRAYAHQLSGGQRQRAMIAMALAGEPDLLIADEPTTALDVTTQAQVLKLLLHLQSKLGMSILFITHDLSVVAKMADRVAVMKDGKIVEQAKAKSFFNRPKHVYSKKLFAALPKHKNERASKKSAEDLLGVNKLKIHFPIRKGILRRTVGLCKSG